MKTAIVTDTSCMSVEEGKKYGIFVLPMPFTIDGEEYLEGVNLSTEYFYEKLTSDASISTSQPSAGAIMDLWDEVLKINDELVFIPISSGLSGTYQNSCMYAQDYDGKVKVVDLGRVSTPAKLGVLDAKKLADKGKSAAEIKAIMDAEAPYSMVYIMVENLDRLKKGGRITPMTAALGTILKIKPILQMGCDKLDSFAKARSFAKAKKIMFDALRSEMERLGGGGAEVFRIQAACSYGYEGEEAWIEDLKAEFPEYQVDGAYLPMNLSCHIGVGGVGCAVTRKVRALRNE